jgi:putative phosphoribosyl transferase
MHPIVLLRPGPGTPRAAGYTAGMGAAYELPFPDRRAAGRLLAASISSLYSAKRPVVLALPRGGVAVGYEIAVALEAPLDVMVTRKIGYPGQPELGLGAIAAGEQAPVYDSELLYRLDLTPADLAGTVDLERAEVDRQVALYRGGRAPLELAGRCVIVADDGLATGVTARAAIRAVRAAGASWVVLTVPVAPASAAEAMRAEADEVVIPITPRRFRAVGDWYARFDQLTDAEVLALLGWAGPGAAALVLFGAGVKRRWCQAALVSGGVGAAHAAAALGGALVLVQAAPGAVLLRPRHRVIQAFQAYRA